MKVGDLVCIARDETKYPSSKVWRYYKGREGVVTCVVRGTGLTEYGVSFTKSDETDAYFKRYELVERN